MNDKNISAHAGGGSNLLVFILTLGVFGILNTEMGVIGMLPLIADTFQVSVPQAGWVVTIFALVVALSGPIMPVLFSKFDRKTVMLLALGIFIVTSLVAAFTENFAVLLLTRAIPAFFHPVYVSMAFTVAAASVSAQDAPKAVARVFIGVSAGMVLGVPAASFIASEASYSMTMLFFAAVNVVVFVATLFCVPSMPVTGRLTYGEQLQVLKKPVLWYAVAAVIFNNGAVFGFFSYLADFLKVVTVIPFTTISMVLFVFGAANIIGNVLAGKLLAHNAPVTIKGTPFAIAVVFTLLFALGDQFGAVLGIVLLFGTLTGLSNNNSQYMIVRSAAEVPEFANGLFLSSANTGTAVGTALCGLFIAEMGTRYAVGGAMLCLAAATIAIFMVHSRRMQCRQEPQDFAEQEHLELVESMD
ncbi:MFS transporter [Bilophila wadsworthia]|uniref:MFS transporter n=1 Tax=Bilophila wadsworthia TaxID=35833 RepID=UPI001EDC1C5E|nr:MFS transporter [Bilophila wadsworthia]MCG4632695.1 MFS transporter [Bilophila wadsworthia]